MIPAEMRMPGGQQVLLDADLAALYGTTTKRLNEQVRRNQGRFPADFIFRLEPPEVERVNRSQFATGSQKHRDPRFPPLAFTVHGATMAAMVLNSPRAVEVSVYVVRAFVRLRELVASGANLARKLDALERSVAALDARTRRPSAENPAPQLCGASSICCWKRDSEYLNPQ